MQDEAKTTSQPRRKRQSAVQIFAELHARKNGFVMPNAWDAGSAIVLANEGFEAIATTSAGIAFSIGRPDYDVPGCVWRSRARRCSTGCGRSSMR